MSRDVSVLDLSVSEFSDHNKLRKASDLIIHPLIIIKFLMTGDEFRQLYSVPTKHFFDTNHTSLVSLDSGDAETTQDVSSSQVPRMA